MLFELLARRSNVQVARYLGPIVIHVPNTVADDLVNTMGRAKECCHEVKPKHILSAGGSQRDSVSFRHQIKKLCVIWCGCPWENRLFLDRDDIHPILKASGKMRPHGLKIATDTNDCDIGSSTKHCGRVVLDGYAEQLPKASHLP